MAIVITSILFALIGLALAGGGAGSWRLAEARSISLPA